MKPLTPEQIREKLKSGDLKIVSAPQDYVGQYDEEIHKLLTLIAPYMNDDMDPEEWAATCFVSDMSQLGDFLSRGDEDTPKHVQELSEKLGFPVERKMYIYEIAARMHGVQ